MRIRLDFVTNSSTTCFCITGVCLDRWDLFEKLNIVIPERLKQESPEMGLEEYKEYYEDGSCYEMIEEQLEANDAKLDYHVWYDAGDVYLGYSCYSFRQGYKNLTAEAIEDKLVAELNKLLKEPITKHDLQHYQDGYRDG